MSDQRARANVRVCARVWTIALSLIAVMMTAETGSAQERTFCVGGYDTDTGRSACDPQKYGCFHLWMRRKDTHECMICQDMHDNTCESMFWDEPSQHARDDYELVAGRIGCRLFAKPSARVMLEVVDGQVVQQNATPQSPTTQVGVQVEVAFEDRVYTPGDTPTVSARAIGSDGKPRPITSATLIFIDPDGGETRVPGTIGADGTISSNGYKIPKKPGQYGVRVEIDGVQLGPDEALAGGAVSPSALKSIRVSSCDGSTAVQSPNDGATLVAGELVQLVGSAQPGGGALRWMVTVGDRSVANVPATGAGAAVRGEVKLQLPEGETQANVRVQLVDANGHICAGPAHTAVLSALGIALVIDAKPKRCYVGLPCEVPVAVQVVASASASERAARFLEPTGLGKTVLLGRDQKPNALLDDGSRRFKVSFTPSAPNDTNLTVELVRGESRVRTSRPLAIRPQLKLSKPAPLAFGPVQAGEKVCLPLSLDGSEGAEDQLLRIDAELPDGCDVSLLADDAPLGGSDRLDAPPWSSPDARKDSRCDPKLFGYCICLVPPLCGSVKGTSYPLTITPIDLDDLPEKLRNEVVRTQSRRVDVRFEVKGLSFFQCYGRYLLMALGLIVVALLILGFVLPKNFRTTDLIRVAAAPGKLPASPRRRLRDLPGGRSGFYRSASVGLTTDGSHPRGARAPIRFVPRKGGVGVVLRGPTLRRMNPRTRELEAADTKTGLLSFATVYEAGGIYFELA